MLLKLFRELYGVTLEKPSFIIIQDDDTTVIDVETVENEDLIEVDLDKISSVGWSPMTGAGLAAQSLGVTSSGMLADELKFTPTGKPTTILKAAAKNLWRVIVTDNPKRGTWTLSVWYGDTQIFDLGVTTVRARFKFDKPDDWDTKNIYVVFIDKDGKSLKAFPAT